MEDLVSKHEKRQPILTIAIPTWNRASFLATGLLQLKSELSAIAAYEVEIIVSDNCSPDETPAVVSAAVASGLAINYVRNATNLGWALNFIQCYELASGRYVLLMGDDDLLVDGALISLIDTLKQTDYGVVCLLPYGFDDDFRVEHPGLQGRDRPFDDPNEFLMAISRHFTLTSSCVFNKTLLEGVDTREFAWTDLAIFHLVIRAALASTQNLYVERYLVGSKRQNSFSYEYSEVFVNQLWRICEAQVPHGLERQTLRKLETKKLLTYYPFYLFDLRWSQADPRREKRASLRDARANFSRQFGSRWLFWFWLGPSLYLPGFLAIPWAATTTVIGRLIDGQLRRGFAFALNRVKKALPYAPATRRRRS